MKIAEIKAKTKTISNRMTPEKNSKRVMVAKMGSIMECLINKISKMIDSSITLVSHSACSKMYRL